MMKRDIGYRNVKHKLETNVEEPSDVEEKDEENWE
jgi:hypothetical protein